MQYLRIMENISDGLGGIKNSASIAADNEQETICSLKKSTKLYNSSKNIAHPFGIFWHLAWEHFLIIGIPTSMQSLVRNFLYSDF